MGDLDNKVKLDLTIHVQDERTSDKFMNFICLSLVIIFNLITAYILWTNK